jgi:hypothetical protein
VKLHQNEVIALLVFSSLVAPQAKEKGTGAVAAPHATSQTKD